MQARGSDAYPIANRHPTPTDFRDLVSLQTKFEHSLTLKASHYRNRNKFRTKRTGL